jgi:hypothetical protein
MKTGKFLKFSRPGGEVHAYLYVEDGSFRAQVYLPHAGGRTPEHVIDGPSEKAVEAALREWVEKHYPKEAG